MILLTGGTGTIGRALLRRLVTARTPVRCLVRDPKRLGPDRVRVQIALGDLADPSSFRNALRGVDTVVHLAASIRDQPRASIEELNALATLRLVRAAERSGATRFVFASAIGASLQSPTRFFRSKALARRAVESADLATTVFAPSIVYSPGDPWVTLLERFSLLPVMPIAGSGKTRFQPIWAEDVADCIVAALDRPGSEPRSQFDLAGPESLSYDEIVRAALAHTGRERPLVHVPMSVVRRSLRALVRVTLLERFSLLPVMPIAGSGKTRFQPIWAEDVADCIVAALDRPGSEPRTQFDLAGPESLSYDELVRAALAHTGRERPLVHVPMSVVRRSLRALVRVTGPAAFATAEEAELMEEPMVTPRGTADAEALGVTPLRMSAVLAAA